MERKIIYSLYKNEIFQMSGKVEMQIGIDE